MPRDWKCAGSKEKEAEILPIPWESTAMDGEERLQSER